MHSVRCIAPSARVVIPVSRHSNSNREQDITAAGRVSDEDLAALDDLFIRNGYVDLDSSYESPSCCDAPTVYTTYSPGGCKKSVAHYLGADDVPKALFDIEAGFERIVHVERFIGEKTGGPAAVFHP